MAITSGGRVMAGLGRDGSDGSNRPTGNWANLFPSTQLGIDEIEEYPLSTEGALAFETPQYDADPSAFRYYMWTRD